MKQYSKFLLVNGLLVLLYTSTHGSLPAAAAKQSAVDVKVKAESIGKKEVDLTDPNFFKNVVKSALCGSKVFKPFTTVSHDLLKKQMTANAIDHDLSEYLIKNLPKEKTIACILEVIHQSAFREKIKALISFKILLTDAPDDIKKEADALVC